MQRSHDAANHRPDALIPFHRHAVRCAAALAGTLCVQAVAQEAPPPAMRPVDVRRDAIVNVTLVPTPGERLADAVVLMRDGWIERVGARGSFELPAGTTVHDGHGCIAYPGFIDACVRVDSAAAARAAAAERGAHWNAKVTPQVRAVDLPPLGEEQRKALRAVGFAAAAMHPSTGIFRGSVQVSLLGDDPRAARTIRPDAGTAISFEFAGDDNWDRATYPGALTGAIALVRQTFLDAAWHARCEEVWRAHPAGNEPPVLSNALSSLHAAASGGQRVWFDATDERNALRAARIAAEFSLDAAIIGSGREYRSVREVAAARRPVVVPLDFPRAPDLTAPRAVDAVPLRELEHWLLAPTNLAELLRAGVPAAASTVRLKEPGAFARAARRAEECGTTEDELLAALTVNPARMLGIDAVAGEVRPGRIANLVLSAGPIYGEDSHVREVWVAGIRHEVEPASRFPLKGVFALAAPAAAGPFGTLPVSVTIDADERRVSFAMPPKERPAGKDGQAAGEGGRPNAKERGDEQPKGKEPPEARAQGTSFDDARAGFTVPGKAFGVDGTVRGTIVASAAGAELQLTAPNGQVARWSFQASARTGDAPDPAKERAERRRKAAGQQAGPAGDGGATGARAGQPEPGEHAEAGGDERERPDPKPVIAAIPRTAPLGEFGLDSRVAPKAVLVEHATVWTVTDRGILADADLLAVDGKIVAVGQGLRAAVPADAAGGLLVIDGHGLHVTPGLIDCHSHTGLDGGVNEWTQNVTAEVRMGDVVDGEDIHWYRELAGGLTVANQLHGSANPIGGQNSVVKIRWGEPAAAFPVEGAIPGIKFALGENVVRSKSRYPGSRLGVETLLRDRFQSAREYAAAQRRHRELPDAERARTMPPRPDLELEALAEILDGRRIVHCHSYRQDEICMLLRVADDFGFRVGTLQHVLEGYKVADAIARHGAGASTFSDWWAYKVEVMDAIPWNGQMMTKAGVVTSFNSDSDELARRMNTEASKAMRYGGMSREEAIRFVTLSPAKQLRIDDRCGSLATGKDADFVLWSADPLSIYARCLQTWVDGVRRFDEATDRAMRERDARTRAAIVALAAATPQEGGDGGGGGKGGRRGKRGNDPGGGKDPQPVDARAGSTLLSRMIAGREEVLMRAVRGGCDPEDAMPGECGCGAAAVWNAALEGQSTEGGTR